MMRSLEIVEEVSEQLLYITLDEYPLKCKENGDSDPTAVVINKIVDDIQDILWELKMQIMGETK